MGENRKQTAAASGGAGKAAEKWPEIPATVRKKAAAGAAEGGPVRESLALKRKANALRKSMEASLAARGLTEQIYSDMVGDYLELWWTRAELEADIRERGVTVMDEKRGLPVENCAVSARVRVSAQMGKMYKAMGFQELAVKNQAPDGEDDEL